MSKRALVMLEGASNGPLYIQTARLLGLHPVILSNDPSRYEYAAMDGCEAIRVDTTNIDAMIHECSKFSRMFAIAGIIGAQESAYEAVGRLCLYFKLPGPNPTAVKRCCDKFAQLQALEAAAVPIPVYRLAMNKAEIKSAAADIGLPVIVKPAVGIGSTGVRLCRDADELAEHTELLLGEKYIWPSSPRVLVEEFVQGPHYSVELMENEVIGIAAAAFGPPPYFVCHEYEYPAPLSYEEHRRIANVSMRGLRALGLCWGPANVDVRWTTLGPVVIEVNPRLCGAPNPQLVREAYGVDLVAEHIKLAIGEGCKLRRNTLQTAAAQILLPDRDGVLDAIKGETRAAAIPGVIEVRLSMKPKTLIVRKGDSQDRIGYVIAASQDSARTRAILQRAVSFIDWSITPFAR